MILDLFLLALTASAQSPDDLAEPARSLYERARAANPARVQYALERGVQVFATSDSRSFYLLWVPPGVAPTNQPVITTLHGSGSWAFDEFFLWRELAEEYGFAVLALQWWMGPDESVQAYLPPDLMHRELHRALSLRENREGTVLLHGFSRGASNIYAIAAADRQSRDRYYAMILANAGGASPDFPPNMEITRGTLGYNIFAGTYWTMFCGGLDPNPERDGCPAMRRTASWLERYGGLTSLFLEDAQAGHGGFHQTPAHMRAALDAFRDNLALRVGAPNPDAVWQVLRDPDFLLQDASIPNVGLVNGEVWLTAGGRQGMRLIRIAADGSQGSPAMIPGLRESMNGTGYGSGEVVPRQGPDGRAELYVLGLAPPGVNRSAILRLRAAADGRFLRDPLAPVFTGGPDDGNFIGVPDVTPAPGGRLRLTYVSRGGAETNSRTAISSDGGASFLPEFSNPFGELAMPQRRATDTNVDPAMLRLADGGYLAVTMRGARLFIFTSVDGSTFLPSPTPAIEAAQLSPGSTGLFDPTLVQLPDGRIFMYCTADSGAGLNSRVVRAEIKLSP